MASEDDVSYSEDFEVEGSSGAGGDGRTTKKASKPRLESESKSLGEFGSENKRRNKAPIFQQDSENSVDEMESFSAGCFSPLVFRNLLPSSSTSSTWFPSSFNFGNVLNQSCKLNSLSHLSKKSLKRKDKVNWNKEKTGKYKLKRHALRPQVSVPNFTLSSPATSKAAGPSVEKPGSGSSTLTEIEEIMRKLEKMEKAHAELENAIGLSEIEEEGSISSHTSHSLTTSFPSHSVPRSTSKSHSVDNSRKGSKKQTLELDEVLPFPSGPSAQDPAVDKPLAEMEEIMWELEKMEKEHTELNKDQQKEYFTPSSRSISKPPARPPVEKPASNTSKPLTEIEDIMSKLENMEKAHSELEQAIGLSEAEEKSLISSASKSKSQASHSVTTSIQSNPGPTTKSTTKSRSNEEVRKRREKRAMEAEEVISQTLHLSLVEKLNSEIEKQSTLTESYRVENDKLYSKLRTSQEESRAKELELLDQINRLKTDIATVKLNTLLPKPLDSTMQTIKKVELDQLKAELGAKSQQAIELHREISRLKNEAAQKPKKSGPPNPLKPKDVVGSEKEKDYQKTIRGLEKQVRTLQKLMYHRTNNPSGGIPSSLTGSTPILNFESTDKFSDEIANERKMQVQVLESRVAELESELARSDLAATERLKEFQMKFSVLKVKYEEGIKDLEQRVAESERRSKAPELSVLEEMNGKLEKSQNEIAQLKLEISRYKRELEINAKSNAASSSSQANAKQDANTLSLAIKSFKVELSEKEKELIRMKKEIAELNKTNLHLKREREKYLTSGSGVTNKFSLMNRAKSDLISNAGPKLPPQPKKCETTPVPKKKPNSAGCVTNGNEEAIRTQQLQATLDAERVEFEEIIAVKNRTIEAKENMISELKQRINKVDIPIPSRRGSGDDNSTLLDELRSRVGTQNKVIQALKDHITLNNPSKTELTTLKKDKEMLEFRIRELNQELALAKSMNKPENEVLADLSEKVDSLNSRYHYREKQLDMILKIASQNGTYSSSFVNEILIGGNMAGLDDDMGILSPTTAMQLLAD